MTTRKIKIIDKYITLGLIFTIFPHFHKYRSSYFHEPQPENSVLPAKDYLPYLRFIKITKRTCCVSRLFARLKSTE